MGNGDWAWGMGHWAWGIGHGALGIGNWAFLPLVPSPYLAPIPSP
ncbi:hypothetical protein [Microcoleus sp. FACHB-68]|nr:hypothetical protein [Microcoleus sp. FACHB-68]